MGTPTESGVSQGGPEPADLLVDELERRGIGAPAAILLDAHRPLLPLIRQGSIFLGPLLAQLLGRRRHAILRHVIHDPATYERLTASLSGEPPPDRP
jgi:hypothetical protein